MAEKNPDDAHQGWVKPDLTDWERVSREQTEPFDQHARPEPRPYVKLYDQPEDGIFGEVSIEEDTE